MGREEGQNQLARKMHKNKSLFADHIVRHSLQNKYVVLLTQTWGNSSTGVMCEIRAENGMENEGFDTF